MTFSRFLFLAGISTLILSATPSYAANTSAQDFVRKVSISDKFEIESSRLALKKSDNKNVKDFAQTMIDDHTKSSTKLKSVVADSSRAKPMDALDSKHQQMLSKLEGVSGDDFDREYIGMQNDAHNEAVKLFSDYADKGDDQALRNFAAETLPTLKGHLSHVQKLNP